MTNLMIILTSETLFRMWCAGNIVCGFRYKVNIVPVICSASFEFPTNALLFDDLMKV